jgi:hypothetical protein
LRVPGRLITRSACAPGGKTPAGFLSLETTA